MSSKNQLKDIFELDINTIRRIISQENFSFLESFIQNIEPLQGVYFIEYDIFESIINEYIYGVNNQNYDPSRIFVPENKLALFRDVFLEDMDFTSPKTILWYHHFTYYNSEERLYNLLFYHIFMQVLSTESSIDIIFNQALKDWKSSFESNKMPICIDLLLPVTNLIDINEITISDELALKYFKMYYCLTGSNLSSMNKNWQTLGAILRLSAHQSFNHNFYGGFVREPISMDSPEFREEFRILTNKIREFILSFYLNDINFYLKGFEIHFPWWIKGELKTYEEPTIRLEQNRLTLQDITQVIELYNKIQEHNILEDKELELALFNYYELHNKNLISELILYDFIILENIFTRGSETEVSFSLKFIVIYF